MGCASKTGPWRQRTAATARNQISRPMNCTTLATFRCQRCGRCRCLPRPRRRIQVQDLLQPGQPFLRIDPDATMPLGDSGKEFSGRQLLVRVNRMTGTGPRIVAICCLMPASDPPICRLVAAKFWQALRKKLTEKSWQSRRGWCTRVNVATLAYENALMPTRQNSAIEHPLGTAHVYGYEHQAD